MALFDLGQYQGEVITDLFGEEKFFANVEGFWALQDAAIQTKRDEYLVQGWTRVKMLLRGTRFYEWEYKKAPKKKGGVVWIAVSERGEAEIHEGYVSRDEARKREKQERGETEAPKTAKPELTAPLQNYVELHRLTDEINDRHYVIVDGVDGKVHYADVGHLGPEFVPDKGMIFAIESGASDGGDKQRTRLRILSYLNLEKIAGVEGATWLDKELIGKSQERLAQTGFGAEVGAAITRRRQWLVSDGLGTMNSTNTFQPQPRILEQLRQRDLRQAGQVLAKELGLSSAQVMEGERIEGTFSQSVNQSI